MTQPPKPEILAVKLPRPNSRQFTLHRYVETRPAWFMSPRGEPQNPIWQFIYACQVTGARRAYGFVDRELPIASPADKHQQPDQPELN
jgi:hypothetical protein